MELTGVLPELIILLTVISILFWTSRRRPKSFPPGPIGLPIVGYLPFLGKLPYKTFVKLGKKYGNIFSVRLGNSAVVVLNDWPAMKEALINQAEIFNGRPKSIMYETMFNYNDVVFVDGPEWKDRRRFVLTHLRNLGMGKTTMENIIADEINDVMQKIQRDINDDGIAMENYFFFPFVHIIWSIVGGKTLDCDAEIRNEFTLIIKNMFEGMSNTHPIFYMPYLRYILPKFNQLREYVAKFNTFLQTTIERHASSYDEENLQDFVDIGLKEISKRQLQDNSLPFTRDNIVEISKILFLGGTETSVNTLAWGLLYMAVWPSIQQKVQQELDDVIGRERLPTFKDRLMLPYCSAVVTEILRFSSIVTLSVLHTTQTKTELFGYTLPKGTIIAPNIWAVHFDPKYWGDPQVFRPERFLDENGKLNKPEYFVPFSTGGRICLGKALGEMNAFMFLTSLLHKFNFSLKPGEQLPDLEPRYALTLSPQPFTLLVKQRYINSVPL